MKYALLMYTNPADSRELSRADLDRIGAKHEALRNDLGASGELLNGAGLVLPDETVLLRLEGDEVKSQAGPFAAEAAEHVTAYYVVECADEDRARESGAHLLDDHVLTVEVRRIHDFTGM
jgi:hypothetical protein